jgi:hypothetical protein
MQRQIDHARLLGQLPNGTRVYRVPVDIDANNSRDLSTQRIRVYVDAASARDALRYVRDEMQLRPETELTAYGPRGGATRAYVGWYTAIAEAMHAEVMRRQLRLDLPLTA